MMLSPLIQVAFIYLALASLTHAASLEKAESLRTNGLLADAKRELVQLSFDEAAAAGDKAKAWLLLGDIALEEGKNDVARENWTKVARQYPDLPDSQLAQEKLALLDQLSAAAPSIATTSAKQPYPAGTVLVVGPG